MPARAAHERTVERLRLRQAPLAAAAVWFAAGLGVERLQRAYALAVPLVVLLAALSLFVMLAIFAMHRAPRAAWLTIAGLWFALGIAAPSLHPAPARPTALLHYADTLNLTVRGRVTRIRIIPQHPASNADADPVPPWEAAEDTSQFSGRHAPLYSMDLALEEVEDVTPDLSRMVPVTGGIRVSVYGEPGSAPTLGCGDRIETALVMKTPGNYRDPGVFSYAETLLAAGIFARGNVSAAKVQVLGPAAPSMQCRLAAAQTWASARFAGFAASVENHRLPPLLRLSETDAAMLSAMLFGDRSGLTHSLRVGFERTGSFHLFVVSGMHIALLAGAVFWLLRRLRMPAWLASLLTIVTATAYAIFTGFGQPAQRALGMTTVFLLARLLAREHDRHSLNALGAAALAMLVWAPESLFEASFQMTVLAILAIAGLAIPLAERSFLPYAQAAREASTGRPIRGSQRAVQFGLMLALWGETLAALLGRRARALPAYAVRGLLFAVELALIATVSEIVLSLPMALYFHRATVFALPANMVVVPLIAVLAPAAVLAFAASLLNPWLALAPAALTALLLHAITFGIRSISHVQAADLRVPGPPWWVALAAIVAWAACCWLVRRGRWPAVIGALAIPLIAVAALLPQPVLRQPGALELTAIDVGQGDSLLAVNPQGSTMLIDAGGPIGAGGTAEVVSNFDVGEEVVSPYLWSRRMRRVDIVVLSHAHTDHMGGMPAILENFRPRELWVGADPSSPLYTALLAQAARLGVLVRHVHAGEQIPWGSVSVTVLAPEATYRNLAAPRNDDSVVLRLQLGQASALLAGDAERPSEDAMLAAGRIAPVTLLKVGHHGSRTSSNPDFLAAARPQQAVVSVGRGNTFGHPRAEVIARLAAAGTRLYRTDEMGLTTFLLRPDGSVHATTGAAESNPLR